MNLDEIRSQIDLIDGKIIKLLNDRLASAIMTKKFKTKIEDPQREQEVLDNLGRKTYDLVNADFAKRLYAIIIGESKRLQALDLPLIAFQGEHGAYSEMAGKAWNPQLVSIPCREFAELFEGVTNGSYDFGIIPIENTLGGVVGPVNELLISTKLHIVGAIEMPVRHCLLAVRDTDYRELRSAYSHPQALAQCKHFLARNKLDPMPYYDTAGAARMVAEKGLKGIAAIASPLAAQLYNLEIIKEQIEDLASNTTRFLILAREPYSGKGDKCSIIFSTAHKAGTLFKVLEIFAQAKVNLTRIESVPQSPGQYAFFLDFIGSKDDPKIENTLKEVEQSTADFRLMGCYPERIPA